MSEPEQNRLRSSALIMEAGTLSVEADNFDTRSPDPAPAQAAHIGLGRDLFAPLRQQVGSAETGGSIFFTGV